MVFLTVHNFPYFQKFPFAAEQNPKGMILPPPYVTMIYFVIGFIWQKHILLDSLRQF